MTAWRAHRIRLCCLGDEVQQQNSNHWSKPQFEFFSFSYLISLYKVKLHLNLGAAGEVAACSTLPWKFIQGKNPIWEQIWEQIMVRKYNFKFSYLAFLRRFGDDLMHLWLNCIKQCVHVRTYIQYMHILVDLKKAHVFFLLSHQHHFPNCNTMMKIQLNAVSQCSVQSYV